MPDQQQQLTSKIGDAENSSGEDTSILFLHSWQDGTPESDAADRNKLSFKRARIDTEKDIKRVILFNSNTVSRAHSTVAF